MLTPVEGLPPIDGWFNVPGVITDMPENVYHADPVPGGSLSSTVARKLLAPHCPAEAKWAAEHPPIRKREFDVGHVTHRLLLGKGDDVEVIDAANYQTKAAREQRDAVYDRGDVPVLPQEFDAAQAMAAAVRQHPRFVDLFPAEGAAEQSLFWVDGATGVWCRARPDWLYANVTDLKTTTDVTFDAVSKSIFNFGYHQQAEFYHRGAVALDMIDPDAVCQLVFVCKAAPHLVTAWEISPESMAIAAELNDQAMEVWRDCRASGVWPGYTEDINLIGVPSWAARRHFEAAFSDD